MKVVKRVADLPWSVVLGGVVALIIIQAVTVTTVIEVYQHGWYNTLNGFGNALKRMADDEAVLGVSVVALLKYMANETAKSNAAKTRDEEREDRNVSNN